jgi:formate dehydrogenase gamma subunit
MSAAHAHEQPHEGTDTTPEPEFILRFRQSERHMHWAVAVPFMVCWATAAVLMLVYSADPDRPLRAIFWWVHRAGGVALAVLPLIALVRHWYDVAMHLHNTRVAWRWTKDDIRWLMLMPMSNFKKDIRLPDQDKFNAAEKLNFMVLTATVPLYIITGALVWTHQFAFPAWVAHLTMAGLATPLMFGHIFMAVVNPETRVGLPGMITGMVNRHWASHHYANWYRDTYPVVPAAPVNAETVLPEPEAVFPVAAGVQRAAGAPEVVRRPVIRPRGPAPMPVPDTFVKDWDTAPRAAESSPASRLVSH